MIDEAPAPVKPHVGRQPQRMPVRFAGSENEIGGCQGRHVLHDDLHFRGRIGIGVEYNDRVLRAHVETEFPGGESPIGIENEDLI